MIMIGLVGGVASGKSAAAAAFVRLGAKTLDADRAGHLVLGLPKVRDAIRARWGDLMIAADGEVDRLQLAQRVFIPTPQGAEDKKYLESLIHPEIAKQIQKQTLAFAAEGALAVILDAPLLIEAGWHDWCDVIVFVEASQELRTRRAVARGWTERHLEDREKAQLPLEQKRSHADFVIDASGTLADLQSQAGVIWSTLFPAEPHTPPCDCGSPNVS